MQSAECKVQPEAKPLGTPSNRNEKERLKEILDAEFMWSEKDCEAVADYLIASGVIVPPCNVGTTIYEAIWLKKKKFSHFRECKVVGFHTGEFPDLRGHKRDNYMIVYYDCGHLGHIPYDKIGKTVFLSREDAERALEEG